MPVRPVKPTRADTPMPPSLPPGPGPYFTIPLCELDSNTLATLCSNFRSEVFKLAGKEQPPTAMAPAAPDPTIPRNALVTLKACVCDHDGNVSISGSSQDNELIRRALCTIEHFLNQL